MALDPQTEARIAALEQHDRTWEARDALLTQFARRVLENNLEGPGGAAADVVALEGGQTSVTVLLGKDAPPS